MEVGGVGIVVTSMSRCRNGGMAAGSRAMSISPGRRSGKECRRPVRSLLIFVVLVRLAKVAVRWRT